MISSFHARRARAPLPVLNFRTILVQALGDITRQLCDGPGGSTVLVPGMGGVWPLRVLHIARGLSTKINRFSPNQSILVQKSEKHGIFIECHIECDHSSDSFYSYYNLLCFWSKLQKRKIISSLMISRILEICMWNCI